MVKKLVERSMYLYAHDPMAMRWYHDLAIWLVLVGILPC